MAVRFRAVVTSYPMTKPQRRLAAAIAAARQVEDMHQREILVVLLAALGIASAAVSYAVAVSSCFSPRQKVAQILIVWLVPVVGSIVVGMFLVEQADASPLRTAQGGAPDRHAFELNWVLQNTNRF